MKFLTGKSIPRRTFLRGMGATVALPYLDAMVPGVGASASAAPRPRPTQTRLVAIEAVHGAAGCNTWGATQEPVGAGRGRPRASSSIADGALTSLEP